MSNEAEAQPNEKPATTGPTFGDDLADLLSGINLLFLIVAIGAGIWGSFDGMTDAAEERPWGNLALVATAIYAGWCMWQPSISRRPDIRTVMLRFGSACLIAPGLVAVPVAVVVGIAVLFPGVRAMIEDAETANGGFHYYWSEGIGSQVFLMLIAGWLIGACVALGVALILTLPILSLRSPKVVATGSHIEKVATGKRDSTSALVYCGLGAMTLGIVLWVFGGGRSIVYFAGDVERLFAMAARGIIHWGDTVWPLGVVFVAIGIVLMGWGCVRVIFARQRVAREQ